MLECERLEPPSTADACVIWLHGLGASGHDFVPVVPHLDLPEKHGLRFIFPHAPQIPVTINGGMTMPAWYDITAMSLEREIDHSQILASSEAIRELIAEQNAAGIPTERIVLAGFSQGGAVAYECALSHKEKLAGLMCMSTYFATAKTIELADANQSLPIAIFHGTQDPMVPEVMGHNARQILESMGFKPDYHAYPMAHEVCMEQIIEVGNYLKAWLNL